MHITAVTIGLIVSIIYPSCEKRQQISISDSHFFLLRLANQAFSFGTNSASAVFSASV